MVNMADNNNLYKRLLEQGFSKQEIHATIHKFMLLEIEEKNQRRTNSPKRKPHVQLHFKLFYFLNTLSGKALCLLKTQFAKKPKNPI